MITDIGTPGVAVESQFAGIVREVKRIIEHTARVFRPDLFLVDKEPLGLLGEVRSTLALLRRQGTTRLVLGLRDIMDDPTSLVEEWRRKRAIPALKRYYDQIWVYGLSQVYDPIESYGFPADVAAKTIFTGYLPGETNPDAGVIATSPATTPEHSPSSDGRPRMTHSPSIQVIAPAAAAMCVTTIARPARPSAATAGPELSSAIPTFRSSEMYFTAGSAASTLRFATGTVATTIFTVASTALTSPPTVRSRFPTIPEGGAW